MCGCGIINLFTESRKVYELVLNRAINFELILNIKVSDKIKKLDNTLLSNSENREHLKNFRNVDCVPGLTTIKFRIRRQTSKPQTYYRCCLPFSYLAPYWLISRNTITFHKYFWCSRFCEFHSNNMAVMSRWRHLLL